MAWYLNRALTNFRNEVNARWPNRDKASEGTIGDEAHQSTNSDHNPDSDGSVDAWDMDVDVNGPGKAYAADVEKIKRTFEAHEASHYWIHDDQIAFRSEGWKPRSYAYAGPKRNRHDKHVHFNTRPSHERSTKPWFMEDDMPLTNDDKPIIQNAVHNTRIGRSESTFGTVLGQLISYDQDVKELKDTLARLETKPVEVKVTVDVSDPTVLDAIANKVADVLRSRLES